MLKTLKSILPQPNLLPTTWKGVLKVLGKTCLSRTTFLCSTCQQQCIKTKYGMKKCMNNSCLLYTKKLKSNEIVEIVNFDVRSQIQSIVRRNISVLSHPELFPKSDICYGSRYQQVSMQQRNPITIILHSDGAPLIKTSKQSLGHSIKIRQVDPATTSKFVETFRICREFFADHFGNKLF